MPPLQVRDMPQELYDSFKHITELEHRSLAQQTIVALEYYLENHEIRGGKVVEKSAVRPQPFVPFEKDGVTYMVDPNETPEERKARLEALFARIEALPKIELPDDYPSVVDIIREEREARTDRILRALEEGPWR